VHELDLITKLVSLKVYELSIFAVQKSKKKIIADNESIAISLEIYRRELLNLKPISQRWIRETLNISTPTINKLVNNLIKEGFVRKLPNRIDRRKIDIVATPKLLVRNQTYISTLLLGMDALGLMKLSKAEKIQIKDLISDSEQLPILLGLDKKKLKLITDLWSSI
tara:strand:- start:128 stop:625 length:498 start_codon:yes stop_codon:yes gene_type:complete